MTPNNFWMYPSVLGAIMLIAYMWYSSSRRKGKHVKQRSRRFSVGLTVPFIEGSFPPTAGVPNHIINGIAVVSGQMDLEQLRRDLQEVVVPHMRFSSIPSVSRGTAVWTPVKVDVEKHIIVHEVDKTKTDEGDDNTIPYPSFYRRAVDDLINTDLRDRIHRPWWEVHIVTCTDTSVRSQVFVFRIEHCIGDGVSLMEVLSKVVRDGVNGERLNMMDDALFNPDRGAKQKGGAQKSLLGSVVSSVGLAWKGFSAMVHLLSLPMTRDTSTALHLMRDIPKWHRRRVVYLPPIALSYVKDIKNKAGAGYTVNDVLYAAYAGAIRSWLNKTKNSGNDKLSIRTLTPLAFSVPPVHPEEYFTATLRVYWCFISAKLPVHIPTPRGRLDYAHGQFYSLKHSVVPAVSLGLQQFVSALAPRAIIRDTCLQLMRGHSTVFSNVPGPQKTIYLAGAKVADVYMCFPNVPPQVGILSYNNRVCFCLTADERTVELMSDLPQFYLEEMKALGDAVGADTTRITVF